MVAPLVTPTAAYAATPACANPQTPTSNPSLFAQAPQGALFECTVTSTGEAGTADFNFYDTNWTNLGGPVAGTSGASEQNVNAQGQPVSGPIMCASVFNLTNVTSFFTCMWRGILAGIGTAILQLASVILVFSAALFNFAIDKTVIDFNNTIYTPFATAIEGGWAAFRDLANIAIIGIFTFIAINIILGNKTYGQKTLIARVLIIAVLINFSLLFTKIIINGSNFVANQFYTAASLNTSGAPQTALGAQILGKDADGIAGRFLSYMGVRSIKDNAADMQTIADNNQSAWVALAHGIFGAVIFIAASLVLLYGAFLVLTRAILFIFLLITGAIAFASYLLPTFAQSKYGWDAWWGSLLRNAALAPMLMLFLWMTLNIASKVQSTGSLADLATKPDQASSLNAMLSYIIVLGMLYVSFRVASWSSSQIGGFGLAAASLFAPVGLGTSILGQGLNYSGYRERGRLDREIERIKNSGSEAERKRLPDLVNQRARANAMTNKDWNLLNSKLGKDFTKSLGLKGGILAGQTSLQPYGKAVEKRQQKVAETYGRAVLGQKEKNSIIENAGATENERKEAKRLKEERDSADRKLRTAQSEQVEAEKQVRREEAKRLKETVENHRKDEVDDIENKLKTETDPKEIARLRGLRRSISQEREDIIEKATKVALEHDENYRTKKVAVETHTTNLQNAISTETAHLEPINKRVEAAKESLKDYDRHLDKYVRGKVIDPNVANGWRGQYKKKSDEDALKKAISAAGITPTAAPTPEPPVTSPSGNSKPSATT